MLLVVIAIILIAGLNSKNFTSADIPVCVASPASAVSEDRPTIETNPANPAKRSSQDSAQHSGEAQSAAGLEFSQYALAWTPPVLSAASARYLNKVGFALEFELSYLPRAPDYFAILMLAYDGHGHRQLMVGQWRQWFIVMQSDDYKNTAGRRVLSADVGAQPAHDLMVRIELSESESKLFFNNQLVSSQHRGVALLPVPAEPAAATVVIADSDSAPAANPISAQRSSPDGQNDADADDITVRFLLGNSASRTQGWPGRLYAWRILEMAPATGSVATPTIETIPAVATSSDADSSNTESQRIPWLPVQFDFTGRDLKLPLTSTVEAKKANGESANARVAVALQAVPRWLVPDAELLSWSTDYFRRGVSSLGDIVLNFLGFVPFGICCFLVLKIRGPVIGSIIASVLIAAAISLSIELAQTLIPSRYSTFFDVIFNTLGALAGAVAGWFLLRLWRICCDAKHRAQINGEVFGKLFRAGPDNQT